MSYCLLCGDDFRFDDIGGYNPPCRCGARCRDCCAPPNCEREEFESVSDIEDDEEPSHLGG